MKNPRILKIGKYRVHAQIFKRNRDGIAITGVKWFGIAHYPFSTIILGAFFGIIIFW